MTAIVKSQKADGSYVRATQFTPAGRAAHKQNLTRRSRGKANYFDAVHKPAVGPSGGRRNTEAIYEQHAVGRGIKPALAESTRPSTVHPNVHYGSSITPHLERKIDSHLDPKLVRQAKAPTVFHHGNLAPSVLAGATPAHATTGGKARVILGHGMVHPHSAEHEQYRGVTSADNFSLRHIVNHEFAHTLKSQGPRRFHAYDGALKHGASAREEARADAKGIPGKGLYERQGAHDANYDGPLKHFQNIYRGTHSHEPGTARPMPGPKMTPPTHTPGRFIGAGELKKPALIAGGALAAGAVAGALIHHHHTKEAAVAKFLEGTRHKVGQKLDSFSVTPDQARHAGVFGQIGAGTGAVTGAAIGTGIGAAAKHPAQGAGIGAAVGGALGGSGGAALGLYAGRPKKKKKLVGAAPVTLSKANRQQGLGAAGGAVGGLGVGALIGHGAGTASRQAVANAGTASHLADYKREMSHARMLAGTQDFHESVKGRVGMALGGAAVGTALVRHHQRKIAGQVEAPVAKAMTPEQKDKVQRRVATGALGVGALADASALKAGWNETKRAKYVAPETEGVLPKVGTGLKYASEKGAFPLAVGGIAAAGLAAHVINAKPKSLKKPTTTHVKRTTNP
jgi:hypothetical protein